MTKQFKLFGGTIHSALIHALTVYDTKEEAKAKAGKGYHNHYALGRYFEAVERMEADISAGLTIRQAILTRTSGRIASVCLKAVGEPKQTPEDIAAANAKSRALIKG